MEKRKIILPKLRYENAPDMDTQIRIGFEEEKTLLRTDDRDIILNLSDQFAEERAACNRYKIYGKIKMIFRNLYNGTAGYEYLRQRLSLKGDGSDGNFDGYLPYDEFAFIRRDIHRETTAEVTTASLSDFTGFDIITSGSTLHQNISPIMGPKFNWNLYLSYIFSGDTSFPMKYTLSGSTDPLSFISSDGIPFRTTTGTTSYTLTSPVKHGMNQGEFIIINNIPYYINSVGNEYYDSENYVISISNSQLASGVTFNLLVTGKRCIDNNRVDDTTSQYYVHMHKTLTVDNDYIIDKLGFESTIFEDEKKLLFQNSVGEYDVLVERNRMESIIFDFKNPFILTGITNNLGYTPTEIYLSTIFRNGNGFFNYPPKVGYSFNMHDSWIDAHFYGDTVNETSLTSSGFTRTEDTTTFTFYSGNTLPKDSILFGAFVEYSPTEMSERIVSESLHKISNNPEIFDYGQALDSTYSGASINNPVGLYYQTHYRYKLKQLSPYIETSNTNNVYNLPENTKYFPNEKLWKWRDLYDDGYIDPDGYGVNYPYLNDTHYIHKDINFYLRNEVGFTNKKDGIINFNLNASKNKNGNNLLNC